MFNILFTSVGRRVTLVQAFRDALKELSISGHVYGADASLTAPGMHIVDEAFLVCRIADPDYVDQLRRICKEEGVHLLVPLLDPELPLLAAHREDFSRSGTMVLVSGPSVVELAYDKRATYRFFTQFGFPTPTLVDPQIAKEHPEWFPLLLKPAKGSASIGVEVVRTPEELTFWIARVSEPIVQPYLRGVEYTIDVLNDLSGRPRCVVPRRRLEVRAGEVSKGITVMEHHLMDIGYKVGYALGQRGAIGPFNVQGIWAEDGVFYLTEVNPRFGGGVPLSLRAGANFPRWILQMVLGEDPEISLDGWEDGLVMLRYDEAIFVRREAIL